VRKTLYYDHHCLREVVDTIENGVKKTKAGGYLGFVKRRGKVIHQFESPKQNEEVDEVIEDGVKNTEAAWHDYTSDTEEVIENGIRSTNWFNSTRDTLTQETIENGVTKTEAAMRFDDGEEVEYVIRDGIKEVQPLPAQDGNKDWGLYYNRQEDRTKPHTKYVDDVIRDGVKETHHDVYQHKSRVEGVIKNGVKHIHAWNNDILGEPPMVEYILKYIKKKN
jgi:hypothetical protein